MIVKIKMTFSLCRPGNAGFTAHRFLAILFTRNKAKRLAVLVTDCANIQGLELVPPLVDE